MNGPSTGLHAKAVFLGGLGRWLPAVQQQVTPAAMVPTRRAIWRGNRTVNFHRLADLPEIEWIFSTFVKSAKPSSCAAACDTSIILPPTKGPRSVIRTTAERPFSLDFRRAPLFGTGVTDARRSDFSRWCPLRLPSLRSGLNRPMQDRMPPALRRQAAGWKRTSCSNEVEIT